LKVILLTGESSEEKVAGSEGGRKGGEKVDYDRPSSSEKEREPQKSKWERKAGQL